MGRLFVDGVPEHRLISQVAVSFEILEQAAADTCEDEVDEDDDEVSDAFTVAHGLHHLHGVLSARKGTSATGSRTSPTHRPTK